MRLRPHRPAPRRSLADNQADQLAVLAAAGDQNAFEQLCGGLVDDIWRYCWSLTGDRDLADDATQETFARATTAITHYRGDAPVRMWLVVLARRSLGHTIEASRRAPVPAEPDTVEAVADHSMPVEVAALVEALPTDQRQAFVLTQVLGFDYATAAEILEVPIGTVRSRIFRARDALVRAWTDTDTHPTTQEVTS
ncbi:MAG: RNA polymerase sigma factor [Acidimicrobiia bacterium]